MRNAGVDQEYKASAFKSNGETLVKCQNCGLVFIDPFPLSAEKILNEYESAIDMEYVSQIKWRIDTFKKSIKEIERITGFSAGTILDVGAAAGAFVKAAKDRGWYAQGIEPCKFLVEWGIDNLGLKEVLDCGTVDMVDNGEFNVVTLWDVIEHTTDPNGTIGEVAKRVENGGYAVINIPDISSIVPRLMGKSWPFYESAHLYYFTPTSLDRLMQNHGFERVYKNRYYQELSLGYLSYRISQFSPFVSKIMVSLVSKLGLSNIPIKYWIGQSILIYKLKK